MVASNSLLYCLCESTSRLSNSRITVGEPAFFPTIEAYTDAPIVGGNRVEILLNGDQTFPVMLRDIKTARSTITFAQYLYEGGSISHDFAQAFAERCRAGVQVHILIDSQGSGKIPGDIPAIMQDAGCQVKFFRRVEAPQIFLPWKLLKYNYRNHRRVLGITEAWTGDGKTEDHWRETNARMEGPIVKYLQAAFTESWLEATGTLLGGDAYFPALETRGKVSAQIVKSSPIGGSFQNYMLFLLSISAAKKSILITNSYCIPDDTMIEALLKAAARGVRVVVLVPGKIDHEITYRASRSNYGRMLLGGIQIFEYMAALLHAKTMVVDGVWASVGSTNFDNRSFALNEELNLTSLRRRNSAAARSGVRRGSQVREKDKYEEWNSRGIGERIFEWFSFPVRDYL